MGFGYYDAQYGTLYGSGKAVIRVSLSDITVLGEYEILSVGRVLEVQKTRHTTVLHLDHHTNIPDADCAVLVAVTTEEGREHAILWRDMVWELRDGINKMVPPDDGYY
jgi:hypothetical protein